MNLLNEIRLSNGIVIGGHRGQKNSIHRENTIECFETVKGKVLYIEVDVQITKDKQLVLYHDVELNLSTPLNGLIRDYNLDYLHQYFSINTVEEVIQWAIKANMGVAFELKLHTQLMWDDRLIIADKLGYLINKHGFSKQCFVFGVDYNLLSYFKTQFENIPIGLIVPFVPNNTLDLMESMRADVFLNYARQIPVETIKLLNEKGYLVDGSIVNDYKDLLFAKQLGIKMVESDYPLELLEKGENI